MRSINPYNGMAFYPEPIDEHEQCPLYIPANAVPTFQVEVDGVVTTATADLYTIDNELVTSLGSLSNTSAVDGTSYITRGYVPIGSFIDEGMYRVHLDLDGTTYYSHPFCMENAFTLSYGLLPGCTTTSGGYQFTYSIFGAPDSVPTSLEFDFGNGWEYAGPTSGSFDQDSVIGSGTVDVYIRIRVFYPEGDYYKKYQLSFDTADPCNTDTTTEIGDGGHNIDRYMYLEWWNTNDLQSLGLLYQNGYKQRVYFKGAHAYPASVTEETFIQNGQNELILESASISEQVNIDIYPVPDYLITVLASVRYHDNVQLVSVSDATTTTIKNFSFLTRTTENDVCSIGTIQGEVNKVWIAGCQENKTL